MQKYLDLAEALKPLRGVARLEAWSVLWRAFRADKGLTRAEETTLVLYLNSLV